MCACLQGMLLKREGSGAGEHLSEQRRLALKRRLRTNRMLIAMVVVFVTCWLPSVVFNFLRGKRLHSSCLFRPVFMLGAFRLRLAARNRAKSRISVRSNHPLHLDDFDGT